VKKQISHIVFTRNRPLQLHGYLESLYRNIPASLVCTRILWKEEKFTEEYRHVFAAFPHAEVIKEREFYHDCMRLIAQADAPYLLFGVDDVVFFDSVDWPVIEESFSVFGSELFGFSLRLDPQQLKPDNQAGNLNEKRIAGQTVFTVDWTQGQTPNSRYPFELCATIYRTGDVQRIVRSVQCVVPLIFRLFAPGGPLSGAAEAIVGRRKLLKWLGYIFSPNTLESWTCKRIQRQPNSVGRLLALQKICASAIQVNLVNTSTINTFDLTADFTVESLAEKYRMGSRIDLEQLAANKPIHTHTDGKYFYLTNTRRQDVEVY